MPLTCECDLYGDYEWFYERPQDYGTLQTKVRVRCTSCNDLIDLGAVVAVFACYRFPKSDLEENIYGGEDAEIQLADKRICERCADLYFSFEELGFACVSPTENMMELAKEYADVYGPREAKA